MLNQEEQSMKPTYRKIWEDWDPDLREYIHPITEGYPMDGTGTGGRTTARAVNDIVRGIERIPVAHVPNGDDSPRMIYRRIRDRGFFYFEIRGRDSRYTHIDRYRRVLWRDDRLAARRAREIHRKLAERFTVAEEIEYKQYLDDDGAAWIWVQSGGRDCDQCEWTTAPYQLPANARKWIEHTRELEADSEGAVWYWILHPLDVPNARSGKRDLALEAYEDGHPSVVHPRGPLTPC
jgi:hypothetical protein